MKIIQLVALDWFFCSKVALFLKEWEGLYFQILDIQNCFLFRLHVLEVSLEIIWSIVTISNHVKLDFETN